MKKAIFEVVKPGLLTTVQDIGRYGYQQYGIVVSGAMDQFAHRLGNLLVGNEPTSATLEVTMMGPKLQVLEDTVIAITGANLSVTIDNQPIEPWKSLFVKKGEILSFGKPEQGVRAYIAVMGGFEGEQVLGSKATYLKAKMGGIAGRELEKGDVLYCGQMTGSFEKLSGRIVSRQLLLNYEQTMPFRVVLGPEEKSFTEAGLKTFFSESFEITREIDRMGCRLSGPVIEHKKKADIISDAITFGTIQVPASGQPIILLADRQTSGGYARIGTIITVDLPRLAQQMPGTKIRFEQISIEEAQQLYVAQEQAIKRFRAASNTE
ncbi:biotin-dependent carboxyltransferase family protein [Bacillaceae bacterium IKA-2]|nr:biotin-dependent carboxyltransferase family protein [Bacillaceae bacterium IKA-2]